MNILSNEPIGSRSSIRGLQAPALRIHTPQQSGILHNQKGQTLHTAGGEPGNPLPCH